MNPFKIENAKQRFFNSKDEYLSFKKAWKDFHNFQPLVNEEKIEVTPWSIRFKKTYDRVYANVKVSVLGPEHYMLYNLLRGYEHTRGFKPLTNKNRLMGCLAYTNQPRPWFACDETVYYFIRLADNLTDEKLGDWQVQNTTKMFEKLSLPFGGRLTKEMVITVGQLLKAERDKDAVKEVGIPITRQEALSITQNILETAERERSEAADRDAGVKKGFLARVLGL